ncbi:ferredoxin, partial [Choiromyces venosus 120613-1]
MLPRAPTSRLLRLLLRPQSHLLPRRIPPSSSSQILPSTLPRQFSTTPLLKHGHTTPPKPGEELYVTFIDKSSIPHKFAVSAGDNLLDIAQEHGLDMEGACGGSAACSTCHVIVVDDKMYERIPEPEDDENDMLDLAFGLTETYVLLRLGCQVKMS